MPKFRFEILLQPREPRLTFMNNKHGLLSDCEYTPIPEKIV